MGNAVRVWGCDATALKHERVGGRLRDATPTGSALGKCNRCAAVSVDQKGLLV
jgi:hypothetical protein